MGFQVFPTPASSADLGRIAVYTDGSVDNINISTSTIVPGILYYTTNKTHTPGLYVFNGVSGSTTNQIFYFGNDSTIASVGGTPTTAGLTLVLTTTASNASIAYTASWSFSNIRSGLFRWGTSNTLNDVKVFDTGIYMAALYNGNGINQEPIAVSTNGTSWTRYNLGLSTNYWEGISVWRGSTSYYALVAQSSIYQSTDTVNWSTVSTPFFVNSGVPEDIYYDSVTQRHYAVNSINNVLYTSTNITNWSTASLTTGTARWRITRSGNYLMALGNGNSDVPMIEISTNGTNWTKATIPGIALWSTGYAPTFFSVAYNNSRYVANSTPGIIVTSTDGLNWTTSVGSVADSNSGMGIIWDGTFFIAGGNNTQNPGWRFSTDGLNWVNATTTFASNNRFSFPSTHCKFLYFNTNLNTRYYYVSVDNHLPGAANISTAIAHFATTPAGLPVNQNAISWTATQYPITIGLT